MQNNKLISLFLRFSIAAGFLSAVLDRFGAWPTEKSTWGNWENFVNYTGILNPWSPESFVPFIAILATAAEIIFSLLLIMGYKTSLVAKASGYLLLIFALAMTLFTGIKGVFDYSVLIAAAGAFALSYIAKKDLADDRT